MTLFWIILIVSVASLIKGISGFGFALVALPPLLIWYSPAEIIPVLVICNFISSTIIVLQKKDKNLVPPKVKPLIVTGAIFTLLGVLILKNANEENLIHIISMIFIALTGLSFFISKSPVNYPGVTYPVVGAVVGLLTGSTSVSGPPLAIFLNSAKINNQEFREIFSWFNITTSVVAIIGYFIADLITMESLKLVLLFTPMIYIGSYIGKRLNSKIPSKVFKNSTLVLTLISCVILLFK